MLSSFLAGPPMQYKQSQTILLPSPCQLSFSSSPQPNHHDSKPSPPYDQITPPRLVQLSLANDIINTSRPLNNHGGAYRFKVSDEGQAWQVPSKPPVKPSLSIANSLAPCLNKQQVQHTNIHPSIHPRREKEEEDEEGEELPLKASHH